MLSVQKGDMKRKDESCLFGAWEVFGEKLEENKKLNGKRRKRVVECLKVHEITVFYFFWDAFFSIKLLTTKTGIVENPTTPCH